MTSRRDAFPGSRLVLAKLFVLSGVAPIAATVAFVLSSDQFLHWFIVPVTLCGMLVARDAADWLLGRTDTLDPVGVVGLLGVHFFYLAPMLHVQWQWWMSYVTPPPDWRDWLGGMGLINLVGLLLYRAAIRLRWERVSQEKRLWALGSGLWAGTAADREPRGPSVRRAAPPQAQSPEPRAQSRSEATRWQLDKPRFAVALGLALAISAGLQFWIYQQYGGVAGYVQTYVESVDAFQDQGRLFMISESFPILALMGYAVFARDWPLARTRFAVALVLIAFLAVKMLFGGLRGSRSSTIWALFWAVGILHLWVRPVSRRTVHIGLAFLLAFMYFYGFYKAVGLDGLKAFEGAEARARLTHETRRTFEDVILGDLGRSDVQAYLLYRLASPESDYELALGRTYLGTLALLIPRQLWPERPPTKVKEGTSIQYGIGSYTLGGRESSRIYGLVGETMLNFGFLSGPFAFIPLGLIVGHARRRLLGWGERDPRTLFMPLLVILCFVLLINDSDNNLWIWIKSGLLPGLVLALASRKGGVSGQTLGSSQLLRSGSGLRAPGSGLRALGRDGGRSRTEGPRGSPGSSGSEPRAQSPEPRAAPEAPATRNDEHECYRHD